MERRCMPTRCPRRRSGGQAISFQSRAGAIAASDLHPSTTGPQFLASALQIGQAEVLQRSRKRPEVAVQQLPSKGKQREKIADAIAKLPGRRPPKLNNTNVPIR